jgi:hypothetical protein
MKPGPVLALLLSLTFVAARVPAWGAEPDPDKLLLYDLLDLDQQGLFEPQNYSPLAEVHARADLYIALRAKARTDTTDDRRYLKSFLLMGWIARVKSNFAVVEGFNTDFMELFESKPNETLKVMFAQDFLLIEMCSYLGKYFFFEKNDPQGHQAFENRHRAQMNAVLGHEKAKRCLDALSRFKS